MKEYRDWYNEPIEHARAIARVVQILSRDPLL